MFLGVESDSAGTFIRLRFEIRAVENLICEQLRGSDFVAATLR